jgi:hypothetical protein
MSSSDIHTYTVFLFTILQFVNLLASIFLITTGIFLIQYVKAVIHGIDRYIHFMLGLHVVASLLILFGNELQSGKVLEGGYTGPFLHQFTILTLIAINSCFQYGIYKFFHNASCNVCVIKDFLKAIKGEKIDLGGINTYPFKKEPLNGRGSTKAAD